MVDFEKRKTRAQLEKQVRDNWNAWRLVLAEGRGFDYATVFGTSFMTPEEIDMANIALDIQMEREKEAIENSK